MCGADFLSSFQPASETSRICVRAVSAPGRFAVHICCSSVMNKIKHVLPRITRMTYRVQCRGRNAQVVRWLRLGMASALNDAAPAIRVVGVDCHCLPLVPIYPHCRFSSIQGVQPLAILDVPDNLRTCVRVELTPAPSLAQLCDHLPHHRRFLVSSWRRHEPFVHLTPSPYPQP
jgi:hypothetical protein